MADNHGVVNKLWTEPNVRILYQLLQEAFGTFIETPADDEKHAPVVTERVRMWAHGSTGLPNCPDQNEPVYTPPNTVPENCRPCGNDEWHSRGFVTRNKETKEILHKEK